MLYLIISGSVAFVLGILVILFPGVVQKIVLQADKTVLDVSKFVLHRRQGIGICLILTAACLWFIAYYMKAIPHLRYLAR